MPPFRPLPPLFDVATFRWISSGRLRPGYAFHIQRRLFHGVKRKKIALAADRMRKEDSIYLSFPRAYSPFWDKFKWTTRCIPQLLTGLFRYGARYLIMWTPPFQEEKGVVVKSRIGRFFYHFVTQPGCLELLNRTMSPWGAFIRGSGRSMLPTLGANPSIGYVSWSYVDKRDVRRGDVVDMLGAKFTGALCKRVAALEGDRVWVTGCHPARASQRTVLVPPGHCFLVGDNTLCSVDSRYFGALPIEGISGKLRWQWGLDGFFWVKHRRYPWLKNKAIVHLAPGKNHPTGDGPLITPPEMSPTMVPRSNEKPLLSPPPHLKKQQTVNKQQKAKQQQKEEQRQKAKQRQENQRKKR